MKVIEDFFPKGGLATITALVMAKTDIPTIQKISGHKTAAMVLHYVHVFSDHVHDAIRALDPAFPETIARAQ